MEKKKKDIWRFTRYMVNQKYDVEITCLQEYQNYLKAILLFFDEMCRKNKIDYSVIDGTLLGAVRNSNIIPWDGDIDVIMTRKNLDKFKMCMSSYSGRYYINYLPSHAFIRNGKKDYLFVHCQLIDKKCSTCRYNIDIFTFDFVGDNKKKGEKALRLSKLFWIISSFTFTYHLPPIKKSNSLLKNLRNNFVRIFHPVFSFISQLLSPLAIKIYMSFEKKYLNETENSMYVLIEPFLGRFPLSENTILNGGYINLKFGNISVMAIKNFDDYLIPTYGNYMVLPPEKNQINEHSILSMEPCLFFIDEELEYYLKKV